jgi:hypothetical protein
MAQRPDDAIAITEAALDQRLPEWRQRFIQDLPEADLRPTVARVRGMLWLIMRISPLGFFRPTPRTPQAAAQAVCVLVTEHIHNTSPESAARVEAALDAERPDWRQKFAVDLPEGIDLRLTVGRVLGLMLLMAEGSPLDHVRSVTGQSVPDTPEQAALAVCAIVVKHLSGSRLVE